jgi:hypothetical protein
MTENISIPDKLENLTLAIEPLKLQALVDCDNTGELPEEMDLPEAFKYWLVARALGLIKRDIDDILELDNE